jgi:iron complex transport system substrate-binding protein
MALYLRLFSFITFLMFVSCKSNEKVRSTSGADSASVVLTHATRFAVEQRQGYKVLSLKNPWQGASDVSLDYYLIKKGDKIPDNIDSTRIVRTPISSIICMSTTHLSMITALNEAFTIKGISGTDYVYNSTIRELIKNNKILDVGYEDNLNKELIVRISPDLIMAYGIGGESANYVRKLRELGVSVMFNADYLENDPLGKAEWIKVFGLLYEKEREADSIFTYLSEEYNRMKELIKHNSRKKPVVFLGLPWKDTWFISPGNSYVSQLISDAGGEYLWKDISSDVSMPFGLENVFLKAMKAEFWLNSGSVNSKEEILTIDNRLQELPSFKNDNIFNNNNRVTKEGGNDYWESGSIAPQIILKDIAAVLHPELFPGYMPYYYKRIR